MKNNKGFTLIELLVVVLIIGILAAIALPQYFKAVEKSRAAEAQTVMGSVHHAQAVYFMGANTYTSQFQNLDIDLPGGATGNTYTGAQNYNFTLTGGASGTAKILAVRKTGDTTIGLFFGTGTRCCTGSICPSLGSEYTTPC